MSEPEQELEDVRDEPYERVADADPEATDADAVEQSRPLGEEPEPRPSVGLEVNEYDAVEQSRVVPDDEDEYR